MAEQMDREKVVEQAISQIERQFGRGAIMKMGVERVMVVALFAAVVWEKQEVSMWV